MLEGPVLPAGSLTAALQYACAAGSLLPSVAADNDREAPLGAGRLGVCLRSAVSQAQGAPGGRIRGRIAEDRPHSPTGVLGRARGGCPDQPVPCGPRDSWTPGGGWGGAQSSLQKNAACDDKRKRCHGSSRQPVSPRIKPRRAS